tara:strand:- start:1414 stop:2043 length:630 start_codon:yes stop_codon:yes gene_type:complete
MSRKAEIPKFIEKVSRFYTLFLIIQVFVVSIEYHYIIGVLFLYLQPPIIWRVVRSIWGQPEGISYLGNKTKNGNLWWVAFHLQQIFNTFHFLEQALTLIPGAYSSWLRLWGSQIGEKVNWTPECRVVDRTHMNIGKRVLVGNHSYLAAHAIKKRDDKYLLYVKEVEIGDDVVLSYRVTIAPGAKVLAGSFIEAGKAVYPNQTSDRNDKA